MKKALVTGANGFIGSHLVRRLLDSNVEVISVDMAGRNGHIPVNSRFIPCDLAHPEALINELSGTSDIDTFYHLAWIGLTGDKRGNYEIQLENARCAANALLTAHTLKCRSFIGIGSIMENETAIAVDTNEHRPGIGYVYGAGKYAAKSILKCMAADLGINMIWAKITNTYGVGEISDRFINTTIRKIINGQSLKFTSATQNYDFIYIEDIAKALHLIGEKGIPFKTYMISSGQARPLKEYILRIRELLAPVAELHFGDVPFTGINLPLAVFSNSDLVNDTGFSCDVPFDDGILKTYEFLKSINSQGPQ